MKFIQSIQTIVGELAFYINNAINKFFYNIGHSKPHKILHTILNFATNPGFASGVIRSKLNVDVLKNWEASHRIPRTLYFELTNRCNADCVFCPYTRMEREKKTMAIEKFESVVREYVAMGGKSIAFTPIVGDPFADKLLIERILLVDKIGVQECQFYTNAIAATPARIDELGQLQRTRLKIGISFVGSDRQTYQRVMGVDQFDRVVENISHIINCISENKLPYVDFKLDFRIDVHKKLSDKFGRNHLKLVETDAIKISQINRRFDTFAGNISQSDLDRANESFKLRYPSPKIGPCEILFTKLLVLADGRINGCAERDLEATLIIGDLNKSSLAEILISDEYSELISKFRTNNYPNVCKRCSVYQSIYHPRSKVLKRNLSWAR